MGDGRSAEVFVHSDATLGVQEFQRVLDDRGVHHTGYRTPEVKERRTVAFTRKRRMLLANQHFGCIGQGLLTAIGAMVATEDKPAFLVEGDAGFMMHLPEFETAVRYGLHVDLARITTPDLGAVGRALGGYGTLVIDLGTLRTAIDEYVADPKPTILDVRISTSVISIPYRRLHFGQDA